MKQTRKHLFAKTLATFVASGLLLVGYASGGALFKPAPSEAPLPTGLVNAPEPGTAGFVFQGRDGNLVPLSPATSDGTGIASGHYNKRSTENETVSLTDQIPTDEGAYLVVRARSRGPGPAAAPADLPPASGMVPSLALIGLGLWFALYFARSSHALHGHQPSDTPHGFFKPRRKSR